MAIITTLLGGLGLVATGQRHPERRERFEWVGGMLLVAGFVGLGFNLARAAG
ncbi:hypothetical protein [Lichenibacterium dinghuense]|uniref:hypothetical protein n=1 Tax=Lichenibacterium dinghuense TaxID=2895977 RepID=UPI001F474C0A|nr:hypothetical protein [Lichenibacterium sp. 6Y81]